MDLIDKINTWVKVWEKRGYPNGIPDEADCVLESFGKVPSYKRICLAIMKNDIILQSLGYGRPACAIYNALKRMELLNKGKIKPSNQMELFK